MKRVCKEASREDTVIILGGSNDVRKNVWTSPTTLPLDSIQKIIAEANTCKGKVLIGAPPPSACSGKTSNKNAPDYKKWCPRREDDPACVHERLYQKKANLLYQYMIRATRILNCQRVTIVDMIGPITCDDTNFRSLFDNNDIHFRQNFAETLVQRVLSLL